MGGVFFPSREYGEGGEGGEGFGPVAPGVSMGEVVGGEHIAHGAVREAEHLADGGEMQRKPVTETEGEPAQEFQCTEKIESRAGAHFRQQNHEVGEDPEAAGEGEGMILHGDCEQQTGEKVSPVHEQQQGGRAEHQPEGLRANLVGDAEIGFEQQHGAGEDPGRGFSVSQPAHDEVPENRSGDNEDFGDAVADAPGPAEEGCGRAVDDGECALEMDGAASLFPEYDIPGFTVFVKIPGPGEHPGIIEVLG